MPLGTVSQRVRQSLTCTGPSVYPAALPSSIWCPWGMVAERLHQSWTLPGPVSKPIELARSVPIQELSSLPSGIRTPVLERGTRTSWGWDLSPGRTKSATRPYPLVSASVHGCQLAEVGERNGREDSLGDPEVLRRGRRARPHRGSRGLGVAVDVFAD